MSGNLQYQPIVKPSTTVRLAAFETVEPHGRNQIPARAAVLPVVLTPGGNVCDCILSDLDPNQLFGAIGSLYVDNTLNAYPVVITFPDTGASVTIPEATTEWVLAVTAANRFSVASAVTATTLIRIQAVNRIVQPTGLVDPPPVGLPMQPFSQFIVGGGGTSSLRPQNTLRRALIFQMPLNSDGYFLINNSISGTNLIYLAAGQIYMSGAWVPTNALWLTLTTGNQNVYGAEG